MRKWQYPGHEFICRGPCTRDGWWWDYRRAGTTVPTFGGRQTFRGPSAMPARRGRHKWRRSARIEASLAHQRHQRCVDVRLGVAHGGEQGSVTGDGRVAVWVGVAGVALEGEEDSHHPSRQRFRLAEPVGV